MLLFIDFYHLISVSYKPFCIVSQQIFPTKKYCFTLTRNYFSLVNVPQSPWLGDGLVCWLVALSHLDKWSKPVPWKDVCRCIVQVGISLQLALFLFLTASFTYIFIFVKKKNPDCFFETAASQTEIMHLLVERALVIWNFHSSSRESTNIFYGMISFYFIYPSNNGIVVERNLVLVE